MVVVDVLTNSNVSMEVFDVVHEVVESVGITHVEIVLTVTNVVFTSIVDNSPAVDVVIIVPDTLSRTTNRKEVVSWQL